MQARKRMAWTESLAGRPLRMVWGLVAGVGLTADGMLALPSAAQAAPPAASSPACTPEAVQVHKAWLADPMTFPCHLAAKMTPAGLLVQGYVPTSVVRERALQVVQTNYHGAIVDRLQVQSAVPLRMVSPRPAADLQTAAEELLRKTMGETSVRIVAQDNGTVVVYGGVASSEEQLRVGQLFRGLEGCRAVVTRLDTRPATAFAPRPAPSKPAAVAPNPAPLPVSVTSSPVPVCPQTCQKETTLAPTSVAKSLSLEAVPTTPADSLPIVHNGTGASQTTPAAKPRETSWDPTPTVTKLPPSPPPAKGDEVIVLANFTKRAGSEGSISDNDPRVTTGLVTLPSAKVDEVRRAIEATCGADASAVSVDVKGRRELHVTLKVSRLEEWPALRKRLAALPHLALFAVSFDAQPDGR
jgi:hypothetical protein